MYVQPFSAGSAEERELLGGKGANLAEMTNLGLPVPTGVTVTTKAYTKWAEYSSESKRDGFVQALAKDAVEQLGLSFPDGNLPLLSVRSGARVSMPGMMDTILNVGITDATLDRWVSLLGERAALDCYRRFLQMYGTTVYGIPAEKFEEALGDVKSLKFDLNPTPTTDADMSVKHLSSAVARFKEILIGSDGDLGAPLSFFLAQCINAVFKSWDSPRAKAYRKTYGYDDDWGTAVNIQQMVFGNRNDHSCSGVLFTRNPATGEREITGEFLPKAQGEDVVAGVRTPMPLTDLVMWDSELTDELTGYANKLEAYYKDMQDIEFTVESGKLYLLQTRNGKRSSRAAFKIAADFVSEKVWTKSEAISRVTGQQYNTLFTDRVADDFDKEPDVVGLGASGGLVSGVAVFSSEAAINCKERCILVTKETTPNDFAGMQASVGVLTATGGATSHAAVVARAMDKACVVGAVGLAVHSVVEAAVLPDGETTIEAGDLITIDGDTGRVWIKTNVPIIAGEPSAEAEKILSWALEADKYSGLLVDTPSPVLRKGETPYVIDATQMTTGDAREALIALSTQPGASSIDVIVNTIPDSVPAEIMATEFLGIPRAADIWGWLGDVSPKVLDAFQSIGVRVPHDAAELPEAISSRWYVWRELATWDDLLSGDKPGFVSLDLKREAEKAGVPLDKIVALAQTEKVLSLHAPTLPMPLMRKVFEVLG